jgi:hypothetical protein
MCKNRRLAAVSGCTGKRAREKKGSFIKNDEMVKFQNFLDTSFSGARCRA